MTEEAKEILVEIKKRGWMTKDDNLVTPMKIGRMNTGYNLEHRMKVILRSARIYDLNGGLHIFRKTFATRMYEKRQE